MTWQMEKAVIKMKGKDENFYANVLARVMWKNRDGIARSGNVWIPVKKCD